MYFLKLICTVMELVSTLQNFKRRIDYSKRRQNSHSKNIGDYEP